MFVSVEKNGHMVRRVAVDGVDVTQRCFAADDVNGYADCFKLDGEGRKHLRPDRLGAATERLTGTVVIELRKAD